MSIRNLHDLGTRLYCLDINLTRHCNLKCRYCSAMANVCKPQIYEYDKVLNDIDTLLNNGMKIRCITLTGGEPLLYPRLIELIYKIRENLPKITLNIFSNLKSFLKQKEEFYKCLQDCKVNITYTKYNYSEIDYEKVKAKCKEIGIVFQCIRKVSKIMPEYIEEFGKEPLSLNINGRPLQDKFHHCPYTCPFMWNSKIYMCHKSYSWDIMNDLYGTNFKEEENGALDINNYTNEIYLKWLFKSFEFCKYCHNVGRTSMKWCTEKGQKEDYMQ